MEDMKKKQNERGITLITLVITVIILVILCSVSVGVYKEYSNSMKLQKFNIELSTVQLRVDEIANTNEYYIDSSGKKVYLSTLGENLTLEEIEFVRDIIFPASNITDPTIQLNEFRKFTSTDLDKKLNISAIEQDVYINFDKKIVLSANGLKIANKTYYTSTEKKYNVNGFKENIVTEEISYNYEYLNKIDCIINIIYQDTYSNIRYRIKGEEYWKNVINSSFKGEVEQTYEVLFTKLDGSTFVDEFIIPVQEDNTINAII